MIMTWYSQLAVVLLGRRRNPVSCSAVLWLQQSVVLSAVAESYIGWVTVLLLQHCRGC
jgi:hypothetical protein